ncbi:hypothetical protein HN51_017073 [Arachis hypogaea]|uniref:Uncharacterized protein n=1 Tax=Arachis hypogaea TaxID=3818 RepID=A0A445CVS8_ARAHY|nr:uncharacterized protein LOC112755615 [Arachis hypogaea]QHO47726.1 uncharacterized protein DS421_6g198660 [Arachis hypogaea]RYR55053.1 hypothetical protein Ahy_A06g030306 [Arachis hypogaea]
MELLVGPAFTIEVPSSPPHATAEYDADRPTISNAGTTGEIERDGTKSNSFFDEGSGFRAGGKAGLFAGDSSESSSSIGTPDDSDIENDVVSPIKEDDEDEEVQSKLNGLNSLDSLEDSLPIKRGLSNHFSGKSKSFTDLSQVNTVKDLKKQENPFNKRRRVLMASKRSRRSSFYTWSNPQSMPLLPLDEDSDEAAQEQEGDEDEEDEKGRKVFSSPSSSARDEVLSVRQQQQNRVPPQSYAAHMRLRLGSFKSRSLSLADLQEHDEEEEEDDNDNDDHHDHHQLT